MTPRPYRLGQRQAAADLTRARILRAARELLTARKGTGRFSVDAVARRAGVVRMTVYHRFGSRRGLLEALFDSFAADAGLPRQLAIAFQEPDPLEALAGFITAFGRFWGAARLPLRRVRALAALDPQLGEAIEARNELRRKGVRVIVDRLSERCGRPVPEARDQAVEILYTLTSFETFDTLAGPARKPEQVAPVVQQLARAAIVRPEGASR